MSNQLPILPLRDVVVFPNTPVSLIVGRAGSVAAVEHAHSTSNRILLVTQRDSAITEPSALDLHQFACLARLEQVLKLPDGNMKILAIGEQRAELIDTNSSGVFLQAQYKTFLAQEITPEIKALIRTVKGSFERFAALHRAVPPEMLVAIAGIEQPGLLADTLVAPLQLKSSERQQLLAEVNGAARLQRVYRALLTEIEFLQVEKKLKTRAKRERDSTSREAWLNEQMKALQKDVGDKEVPSELEELAKRLATKNLPPQAKERAEKELRKLSSMNNMSAEATVVRNYMDWLLTLPWTEKTETLPSLAEAEATLDAEHHGLEKVKERMIEFLAVASLVDKVQGPILCMVGPPGVGKTSIARSIASATGRPFVKIALGGVRDEAEIRGHRRTYIGSMPGRILQAMKRAKQIDPIILLDEVDKMSSDYRGDPSAALLEVLDPEQNELFNDHYIELDYDLSNVTFICTANNMSGIPLPLMDRLEIIEIPGYSESEKIVIAQTYLLPRQIERNGLSVEDLTLTEPALSVLIREYTRESGVRGLERQLARVCRKIAKEQVISGEKRQVTVDERWVRDELGVPRYQAPKANQAHQVGVVRGLAVSPWGGETLDVEVSAIPGKGKLKLTGRLGDWLKESANAALTFVRSRTESLGLAEDFHEHIDLHIHYPGNPLKTDGPSAGITMATGLVSALTHRAVRGDLAMTGEISLRGRVLPIGGLKEKVLAAHRLGLSTVLFPKDNEKDVADIPKSVRDDIELIPVAHMDEVLEHALV